MRKFILLFIILGAVLSCVKEEPCKLDDTIYEYAYILPDVLMPYQGSQVELNQLLAYDYADTVTINTGGGWVISVPENVDWVKFELAADASTRASEATRVLTGKGDAKVLIRIAEHTAAWNDPTGTVPARNCEATLVGGKEEVGTFKIGQDGANVTFRFFDIEFLRKSDQDLDEKIFLNEIKDIKECHLMIANVYPPTDMSDIIPKSSAMEDILYNIGDLIKDRAWVPEVEIFSVAGIEYFRDMELLRATNLFITELDLSWNKKLKKLDLYHIIPLEKLNVTKCLDLEDVDIIGLNDLVAIDFSKNTKMKLLHCYYMAKFLSIDASGMPDLEHLITHGNLKMKSLDATKNPKLIALSSGERSLVSELDPTGCPDLQSLHMPYGLFKTVDISNCKKLFDFDCSVNPGNDDDVFVVTVWKGFDYDALPNPWGWWVRPGDVWSYEEENGSFTSVAISFEEKQ